MLAWGIAQGIQLFGNQALKARFSLAPRLGRCMETVPQLSRAFSADAFAVLHFGSGTVSETVPLPTFPRAMPQAGFEAAPLALSRNRP
jgi:hypothetical protein